MEITLIRHTAVDVAPGVFYGQTDVPLKPSFEEEAAAVRQVLFPAAGAVPPFEKVFTSPLSRCVRLATYCGFGDATRDARLMEINFGIWEMKHFSELHGPEVEAWYADYLHVAAPEGESFAMQYARVAAFFDELRKQAWRRVALFVHGGVVLSALIYAGRIRPEEAFSALPPYGGIVRITLD